MSVHGLRARRQIFSEPRMAPDVGHIRPFLWQRPQHASQQLQAALGHLHMSRHFFNISRTTKQAAAAAQA